MNEPEVIDQMLDSWFEAAAGKTLSVDELCRDFPQLGPALARRLTRTRISMLTIAKYSPETDKQKRAITLRLRILHSRQGRSCWRLPTRSFPNERLWDESI